MDVLDLRELVSASIHGAAALAVIPASFALWRRTEGQAGRRIAVAIYGFGLTICFAASTVCHTFRAVGHESKIAVVVDHIGIFLLIAGTYTPIVAALLPPKTRRITLWAVWLAAALGIVLNIIHGPLSAPVATGFYLAIGWGGLWCYIGMRHTLPRAERFAIPLGGIFYSIGAISHVAGWPVLWTGVIGAHEVFHVFVVAGAATHFAFIWKHINTPNEGPDSDPGLIGALTNKSAAYRSAGTG